MISWTREEPRHSIFAILNDGDYSWAFIRNGIIFDRAHVLEYYYKDYLQRLDYITITSEYRNPADNAQLDDSAPNSRHVYGDALDYHQLTPGAFLAEKSYLVQAAQPSNASQVLSNYSDHVHADWRFW